MGTRETGGGAFSYKIPEASTMTFWNGLVFLVVGGTLLDRPGHVLRERDHHIAQKNFHIIKVWFAAHKE